MEQKERWVMPENRAIILRRIIRDTMGPKYYRTLVFVDVEAKGPAPCQGTMTEWGAIHPLTRSEFYATLATEDEHGAFIRFDTWLRKLTAPGRPRFVSDNPAYDWQWMNDGFWRNLGYNPFGFSARRIGDFYAGLTGNFAKAVQWKKLRVTEHDHNPTNDALGNVEAWERMLIGGRG